MRTSIGVSTNTNMANGAVTYIPPSLPACMVWFEGEQRDGRAGGRDRWDRVEAWLQRCDIDSAEAMVAVTSQYKRPWIPTEIIMLAYFSDLRGDVDAR